MSIDENKRYVFSEWFRAAPVSALIVAILGVFISVACVFLGSGYFAETMLYCVIAMALCVFVCLTNLIRNAGFYNAAYAIRDGVLIYQAGQRIDVIALNERFFLSKLQLWESSGRSFGRENVYIVLWQQEAPQEGLHPFKLMRKGDCYVLPGDSKTEQALLNWCTNAQQKIPCFPKVLYHPES